MVVITEENSKVVKFYKLKDILKEEEKEKESSLGEPQYQ